MESPAGEKQRNAEEKTVFEHQTVRDYLRVLFRQLDVVIVTVLTVVFTVGTGVLLKTPVYESVVKVLVTAEKAVQEPYYRGLAGEPRNKVGMTESEIILSRPVLERAVRALRLDRRPWNYEAPYASALKRKVMEIMHARQVRKKKPRLPASREEIEFQKAVKALAKHVKVEAVRGTNIIAIYVEDFDPAQAAVIANVVSRSYVMYDLEQQLAALTVKYGDHHPMILQLKDSIRRIGGQLTGAPVSNIEAIGPATVKIIEQAGLPLEPKGLGRKVILAVGLVMALVLGAFLAYLFEFLDPTIRDVQDVEGELRLRLLGSIPRRRLGEKRLWLGSRPRSLYAVYYQHLADQLYLRLQKHKRKSLLLTASDEKTSLETIAVNMGWLLTKKTGMKVLVVDANLQAPKLHCVAKTGNTQGFGECVEQAALADGMAHSLSELLHVLPAGKPDRKTVALTAGARLAKLIRAMEKKYDLVLLAGPKMNDDHAAYLLAEYADSTVLVINEGKTRKQVVASRLQPLLEQKTDILGVIFNHRTFPIPKMIYEWF